MNESRLYRILTEIGKKIEEAADGGYIYRGEAQCHPEVCSGLYRDYAGCGIENPDFVGSQEVSLKKLKEHVRKYGEDTKTAEAENLAQLQHYGARTNLIDFTRDYAIALYFACEKKFDKNGRIIFLKNPEDTDHSADSGYKVIEVSAVIARIESQKSIFVESPTGFIEPNDIVCIPSDLKKPMLTYLKKSHDISHESIYADIHGFIESENSKTYYLEFYKAKQKKDEQLKNPEKVRNFSEALHHYEQALQLKPCFIEVYSELGQIYCLIEDYDSSLENYTKAIKLDPNDAEFYSDRAKVYEDKGEYERAVYDYDEAINRNEEMPTFYYDRCRSLINLEKWEAVKSDILVLKNRFNRFKELKYIADFANKMGIDLPKDVKSLLSSPVGAR